MLYQNIGSGLLLHMVEIRLSRLSKRQLHVTCYIWWKIHRSCLRLPYKERICYIWRRIGFVPGYRGRHSSDASVTTCSRSFSLSVMSEAHRPADRQLCRSTPPPLQQLQAGKLYNAKRERDYEHLIRGDPQFRIDFCKFAIQHYHKVGDRHHIIPSSSPVSYTHLTLPTILRV